MAELFALLVAELTLTRGFNLPVAERPVPSPVAR